MKKFAFPLARVLDWRQMQVKIEQSKLQHIYAELQGVEARIDLIQRERAACETAIMAARSATGLELAALDNFKHASEDERKKLERLAEQVRKRIGAQLELIAVKQRDARLLEMLRDRKLLEWHTTLSRQVDAEAGELHLLGRASHKMDYGP